MTIMSGTSTKAGGFGGGAASAWCSSSPWAEEEEPGRRAAAEDGEQTDGHDDELELVLRGSGFSALSGCAAFRFILCHGRPARSSLIGIERAKPPGRQ
ncbi:hypothetical protein ABIF50_007657 [Bradyrhizobium diazoefficiens]